MKKPGGHLYLPATVLQLNMNSKPNLSHCSGEAPNNALPTP